MRVAVVGSRNVGSYPVVEDTLIAAPFTGDSSPNHWDVELVSGGADGVDSCAERFADKYDLEMKVFEPDYSDWSRGHPAKWRNTLIVEDSDAVVAVWDGRSNGTRDTIDKALDRAKPLYVHVV